MEWAVTISDGVGVEASLSRTWEDQLQPPSNPYVTWMDVPDSPFTEERCAVLRSPDFAACSSHSEARGVGQELVSRLNAANLVQGSNRTIRLICPISIDASGTITRHLYLNVQGGNYGVQGSSAMVLASGAASMQPAPSFVQKAISPASIHLKEALGYFPGGDHFHLYKCLEAIAAHLGDRRAMQSKFGLTREEVSGLFASLNKERHHETPPLPKRTYTLAAAKEEVRKMLLALLK
ncbi:hypothetical protein [Aestuariivirga sp.]|uniref:hypothetical protein n=1 Tax=Aestuariivirga sp. TaxID=2650926 RepID=UPI00391D88D9